MASVAPTTMAKRAAVRVLGRRWQECPRRLCTSSSASDSAAPPPPAARPSQQKALYRQLSALNRDPARSVADVLNGWLNEGKNVVARDLMACVRELRRYSRHRHALEIIDWMENKRLRMFNSVHAVRLDLISKVRGVDCAETYFNSLPKLDKNQKTYGALLGCFCNFGMSEKAVSLFKKMKELGLAKSTLVHNNMLTLFLKLKEPENIISQFEVMKEEEILPDLYSYSILINGYALLNDVEKVEEIVREVEEGDKVVTNWNLYSVLATIYSSTGQLNKVELALEKLEKHAGKSGRAPYHFLISLYAGTSNAAEVQRIWKLLKATFEKTINTSYLMMFRALNKLDDVDALMDCYREWESSCPFYDVRLFNVVIGACLRNDMVQEAESLLEKVTKDGTGPDSRTFDHFIGYYLQNDMGSALRFLEAAAARPNISLEWKLDKEKANAFMRHFEESKDADGAEKVFECLRKLNSVDAEAYESIHSTNIAAGKRRTESSGLERLPEDGIELGMEAKRAA